MRTTVDIPDETYHFLRLLAEERGETLRQLVLEGLEMVQASHQKPRRKFEIPVIPSANPGTLNLDNETIHELIEFP